MNRNIAILVSSFLSGCGGFSDQPDLEVSEPVKAPNHIEVGEYVEATGQLEYDSVCVEKSDERTLLEYDLEEGATVYSVKQNFIEQWSDLGVSHIYLDNNCPLISKGSIVYVAGVVSKNHNIENATHISKSDYSGK
jgi:hypothetical protein